MKKSYYQILQVDPKAEIEVIEAAYKRLARKYHPDINKSSDATAQMRELNESYLILKDEQKRKEYDIELANSTKDNVNTNFASNNQKSGKPNNNKPISNKILEAHIKLLKENLPNIIKSLIIMQILPTQNLMFINHCINF